MFVNIFSSTVAEPAISGVLHKYLGKFGSGAISVIVMTFAILIIGEILPKAIAIRKNEIIANRVAPFISLLYKLATPFRILVEKVANVFVGILEKQVSLGEKKDLTKADLSFFVESAYENGLLNKKEEKFLEGFMNLTEKNVDELLTPRDEIEFIDFSWPLDKLTHFVKQSKHSKLVVFRTEKDNVVGFLYVKDFVTKSMNKSDNFRWQDIIRTPYIIPEKKNAFSLFKEFKERRIHIATAVDEYGTLSGLITLEDILEELIGVEKHVHHELSYQKIDDRTYELSARIPLQDFNELLDTELESEEAVTLGGYLLDHLERLPKKGETLELSGLHYTIHDSDATKIKIIRVRMPENHQIRSEGNL